MCFYIWVKNVGNDVNHIGWGIFPVQGPWCTFNKLIVQICAWGYQDGWTGHYITRNGSILDIVTQLASVKICFWILLTFVISLMVRKYFLLINLLTELNIWKQALCDCHLEEVDFLLMQRVSSNLLHTHVLVILRIGRKKQILNVCHFMKHATHIIATFDCFI